MLQYAENFNLNMIMSAKILHTQYDTKAKRWTVKVQTPSCETMVVCKHLVQATGFGSQKPYMPPMQNVDLYKGVSIHSNGYKTAKELVEKGVKVSFPAADSPPCPTPFSITPHDCLTT